MEKCLPPFFSIRIMEKCLPPFFWRMQAIWFPVHLKYIFIKNNFFCFLSQFKMSNKTQNCIEYFHCINKIGFLRAKLVTFYIDLELQIEYVLMMQKGYAKKFDVEGRFLIFSFEPVKVQCFIFKLIFTKREAEKMN